VRSGTGAFLFCFARAMSSERKKEMSQNKEKKQVQSKEEI
jgi:hypothetical protein